MPVLGFDTAGRTQSVAVAGDGRILAESTIEALSLHSETLLGTVDLVLRRSGVALRSLTAIAVACGPGTFTGLRIGMATAKGLAISTGLPLIGESTLVVLAAALAETGAPRPGTLVCALVSAGRGQVYRGLFRTRLTTVVGEPLIPCSAESICDPVDALRGLEKGCIVGGGGVADLPASLLNSLPSESGVVEKSPPLAPILALMIERCERQGQPGDRVLRPNYVRETDARRPGSP